MRLTNEYLGDAYLTTSDVMTAGKLCTMQIVYRVGKYGIDDCGSLRLVWRGVCDLQTPQFDNPSGEAYTTVITTGDATLRTSYDLYQRPYDNSIHIFVTNGYLKEGDEIIITLGDRSQNCPGIRMQSFCEREHEFIVLVDPWGTARYERLPKSLVVSVIPNKPHELQVVVPSDVSPDMPINVAIRVLDEFGNPVNNMQGTVKLSVLQQREGMNNSVYSAHFTPGNHGVTFVNCEPFLLEGIYNFKAIHENGMTAVSNACICRAGEEYRLHWGDMHGQTKQTVGTGFLDDYFTFARDSALIDFTGWQGNDFEISNKTWQEVRDAVKRFNDPGKFLVFLGYEWSGITSVGGDNNVFFLDDNSEFYPSSNWSAYDDTNVELNANPLSELWEKLRGREDVMIIPHIGGRFANLDYFDPKFTTVIEIHSHHGIFEWFAMEAMKRHIKVGFIATSDDHTCRPGMSYPLSARGKVASTSFAVRSGLTGVFTNELNKKSIWDAIRNRRCYASTQSRMVLDVRMGTHIMGEEFSAEPGHGTVDILAAGSGIMDYVEIYDWNHRILHCDLQEKKSSMIRICCSGVTRRGRNKIAHWTGSITAQNGTITNVMACGTPLYGRPSPTLLGDGSVQFDFSTAGDTKGVQMQVIGNADMSFNVMSSYGNYTFTLGELVKVRRLELSAGGENLLLTVDFANQSAKCEHEAIAMYSFNKQFEITMDEGEHAFWVKVAQEDGNIAWSSALFVKCE